MRISTLLLLCSTCFSISGLHARQYFRPFMQTSLQKWSPRPFFKATQQPAHDVTIGTKSVDEGKPRDVKEVLKKQEPSIFHITAQGTLWHRGAHQTFTDTLGTKTESLSGLVFGQENFRLSNIFQNCLVPLNTQHYNPYMRIFKMHPRITYQETGADMSINIEARMKTFKRTRIGMRISAPLIRREVERKDAGWRASEQMQDVYTHQRRMILNSSNTAKEISVPAYRFDFAEATKKTASGASMILYNTDGIHLGSNFLEESSEKIGGIIVSSEEGIVPRNKTMSTYNLAYGTANANVNGYLPTDLAKLSPNTSYQVAEKDYSALSDAEAVSVAQRIANQDAKAQLWVVPTYTRETTPKQANQNLFTSMDADKRETYANQYEWLFDRNYHLESDQQTGIGNTTVECYLACNTTPRSALELSGGLVIPTATGRLDVTNPYAIHLGNRDHLEAFIGGGWMFKPRPLVQLTADSRFTMVFEREEERTATPVGSRIKNIGAPTTALVSWNYCTTDVALTLYHPKTKTISLTMGYNFYYKTADTLSFKKKMIPSWLGKTYETSKADYTVDNTWTLDAGIAAMRTQAIAHTARLQANYSISRLMHIYGSGSYVFVGKNTPQDFSFAAGCTVTF